MLSRPYGRQGLKGSGTRFDVRVSMFIHLKSLYLLKFYACVFEI